MQNEDRSSREEIDLIPIAWDGQGGLETPTTVEHIDTIIHWQAAEVLGKLDQHALERLVSRIPGSYRKISRKWVIRSWQNLLIFFHEHESDKRWVVRIPYNQGDKHFLDNEVKPLRRVNRMFPNFRKPTLYRCGLASDPDNEIGFNFMLLDFIDGAQMPLWTENFPCLQQKSRLLAQLCDIYIQIFSRPVTHADLAADGAPQLHLIPPETSATEYMFNLVDESIKKLLKLFVKTDRWPVKEEIHDLLSLLMLRSQIPDYIVVQHNDSPFVIHHPDLHDRNIIVSGHLQESDSEPVADTQTPTTKSWTRRISESLTPRSTKLLVSPGADLEVNIAGIVDWDEAHPVPLQLAVVYPKFLDTVPGGGFPNLAQDYRPPDMTQDKARFLRLLTVQEKAKTGHTFISELIGNNSETRNFFTKSLSYKCIRDQWLLRNRRSFYAGEIEYRDWQEMQAGFGGFAHSFSAVEHGHEGMMWLLTYIAVQLEGLETRVADSSWYVG